MPVVWPDGSVTGSLLVDSSTAAAPSDPEPDVKETLVVSPQPEKEKGVVKDGDR